MKRKTLKSIVKARLVSLELDSIESKIISQLSIDNYGIASTGGIVPLDVYNRKWFLRVDGKIVKTSMDEQLERVHMMATEIKEEEEKEVIK